MIANVKAEPIADDAPHLLIVDDVTSVSAICCRLPAGQGLSCHAAADSQEARRKLKATISTF